LRVEGRDAADGPERRADGDPDPVVARGIRGAAADTGVLERQLRRAGEQQRGPVEVPDALGANEGSGREFGDLPCQPAPTGPHREQRQRTQSGRACGEAAPERLPPGPERRDDTDTGDDDSFHRHPSNLRSTTQLLLPPNAIALLSATPIERGRAAFGT